MHRDTGPGKPPLPRAFLAVVILLQSWAGASDATAVELSLLDLRWQMVLDCLGLPSRCSRNVRSTTFDSGGSPRISMVACSSERASWRSRPKAFDPKKLAKSLRVAMDSSPLEDAIIGCVAALLMW